MVADDLLVAGVVILIGLGAAATIGDQGLRTAVGVGCWVVAGMLWYRGLGRG